ncbi:MAG: response regulator [Chloroflexi bacterium]|nr:response regulator [Chloroflexota bacterium]
MTRSLNTILLVEDDPTDAHLLQRAVSSRARNCRLQHAADGEQAIEYLNGVGPFADRLEHPLPQIVLLDLKLPRASGFDVLAWVKSQPRLRNLPIIVLSSSDEPADMRRAYAAGANSYLVKPSDYRQLAALVASIETYWMKLNERPLLES